VLSLAFIVIVIARRTLNDDSEYRISANELFHESARASR
jgi:hypothetical protein